ncbi:MAG TPA: metallopeptidase family protein [Pseudomonadota bacterium]|jgi:predicted Zn-dependent protease with MMP-like domain/predicted Zn-dependent protease|nr:metallopeptidase family protein [Pseudomonadota bacterium]HND10034.1 metallopeptidase family protein [Pseudomonadota bacterium]HNK47208.1 metallopeptidase family protein [Pseudomonadota bacterium]HNN54360.1 metallopeptidase family protein [Pseudomonadota bacterium]
MAKSRTPVEPPSPPPNGHRQNGSKSQAASGPKKGSGPSKGSVEKFYAELDRCWQVMESGDIEEAKRAALKLLRSDGDSPELYVLLGMISAAECNTDEALSHYQHASDIDPEYVEPLLCAAELYLWDIEDFEKAVELCETALDHAEEEEEFVEALLLKAEGEALLGKESAAYASLSELPDILLGDHSYHVRAGRLLLDLGHPDDAESHFQRALEIQPTDPDSLHGLGLCASERGDRKGMIGYYQKVRAADLKLPTPPWGISHEEFSKLIGETMDKLPEQIRKLIANVPVIASDYPSAEQVADGTDPRILGLFSGVPYGDKPTVGGVPHLDTILLFQRNLERVALSHEELEHEIEITLVHEAGHFFGLSEEQLDALGFA